MYWQRGRVEKRKKSEKRETIEHAHHPIQTRVERRGNEQKARLRGSIRFDLEKLSFKVGFL